mmetsp:Transcript_31002/g.47404  ORF Transcript_31002/g.47404 Transcript_31002/m.47404 type:complete len:132 (-) Transcript_31002:1349-1744(-)
MTIINSTDELLINCRCGSGSLQSFFAVIEHYSIPDPPEAPLVVDEVPEVVERTFEDWILIPSGVLLLFLAISIGLCLRAKDIRDQLGDKQYEDEGPIDLRSKQEFELDAVLFNRKLTIEPYSIKTLLPLTN